MPRQRSLPEAAGFGSNCDVGTSSVSYKNLCLGISLCAGETRSNNTNAPGCHHGFADRLCARYAAQMREPCSLTSSTVSDAKLTLSIPDGRKTLREGEIIPPVLSFTSTADKWHRAVVRNYDRSRRLLMCRTRKLMCSSAHSNVVTNKPFPDAPRVPGAPRSQEAGLATA